MRKAIIILTGISEGKTRFINTIKDNGYWTWNVSHMNFLSSQTHKLFWDGTRDEKYYEFIKKFESLVDEYFDLPWMYVEKYIKKLRESEKARVVIVHGIDGDISRALLGKYNNCYDVHILNHDGESDHYRSFNYESETYDEDVLEFMKELTEEKEIE